MKTLFSVVCSILVLLFVLSQPGNALTFFGSGQFASFTGSLDYLPAGDGNATLDVVLTNTSPAGYLTGFVFNNPGGYITGVSLSLSPPGFALLFDNNGVAGQPYGHFDIEAALGGNPTQGIGVNDPGTLFRFALTGTSLNTLNELSFVNELSAPNGDGEGTQFFVARFQGIGYKDDSDKVAGYIPEPSSLLLLGFGLLGVSLFGWFRRQRS